MSPRNDPVLVAEIMTSRVRTAEPGQRLSEIWQMLVDERCHHIPIVDDGRPVGMVSTRDLIRVARKHGARKISEGLYGQETASDVMSTDLQTIDVAESVETAIERIGLGDIHALVVLDEEGLLAGIVTNHDLLDYLIS
jgi:CBS domain-containing protein